jgi:hypothetical protein
VLKMASIGFRWRAMHSSGTMLRAGWGRGSCIEWKQALG